VTDAAREQTLLRDDLDRAGVRNLSSVPSSMLVIGAGATGVQVASIFNAFGSRVHLVEIAPPRGRVLR
jgi:pyruvate/2-oxoglutarate dehydrogenase complex dihydrolipoamide dehydrogenase (E3) component